MIQSESDRSLPKPATCSPKPSPSTKTAAALWQETGLSCQLSFTTTVSQKFASPAVPQSHLNLRVCVSSLPLEASGSAAAPLLRVHSELLESCPRPSISLFSHSVFCNMPVSFTYQCMWMYS